MGEVADLRADGGDLGARRKELDLLGETPRMRHVVGVRPRQ